MIIPRERQGMAYSCALCQGIEKNIRKEQLEKVKAMVEDTGPASHLVV
jgi:hypothetical protein